MRLFSTPLPREENTPHDLPPRLPHFTQRTQQRESIHGLDLFRQLCFIIQLINAPVPRATLELPLKFLKSGSSQD